MHQLYLDSRQSFVQLGKKLKLSNTAVERRLRQLKEAGYVTVLFADVNHTKLGFRSFRLYFKFDVMDQKTEDEVLEVFEDYKRTAWGVVCEGEYDVLWRILAKDELEVEEAAYRMVERFGSRIVEKTIVVTTYQTYLSWNKAFGCERAKEMPIEKIGPAEPVDKIDMKILSSLSDNSRLTTVELAQRTELSPDAVAKRIQRLVKDRYLLGYSAWFEPKELGFDYYKILFSFRSATKEKEKKFLDYLIQQDSTVFINKCIGSWDIEADILIKDTQDLHQFLLGIKTKFGSIIGKHSYVAAIEQRMLNPIRGEI